MSDDGGITRLRNRLNAIPRNVKADVVPALLKQANMIADTMRTLVPVDTEALRESIIVTGPGEQTPYYSQPGGNVVVAENVVAITVGNEDVRYPHLVEYGTVKAPAQPFFWPAFRLHRKKAQAAIKSAVGRAVRKNWGKSS